MFKNYDSTYEVIFFSYTALHFFDVAAASAVRWLHLQNAPAAAAACLAKKSLLLGQNNKI